MSMLEHEDLKLRFADVVKGVGDLVHIRQKQPP